MHWTLQRLAWSAMLMAWSEQQQLTQRFLAVTACLGQWFKHWVLGSSYEGWVKSLKKHQSQLVSLLTEQFRRRMREIDRGTSRWQAFGVDGTTLSCPRTQKNQAAMGDKGQIGGRPLVSLTALVHLQLGLPWAFRVGPGSDSERTHLRDMIRALPALALLVADAGFIAYELCRELLAAKQHFLLRVGGNMHLFRSLGHADELAHIVYLWPGDAQRNNQPPLKLRLIVIECPGKQPVYLATSVLSAADLSDAEAAEIYALRWGVEVKFRTLKQTMEHHKLLSRTPENCYLELTWIYLGVWLLELMTASKLQEVDVNPREASPAQARNVVRCVLRQQRPCRDGRTLAALLAGCRVDRYQRNRPKTSRDYPRKKTQKPPSPPKIKPPDARQLQLAQQLIALTLAT